MGLISDIFAASPAEISSSVVARGPEGRFECLGSEGIETVKLSTLHALLRGESIDDFDLLASRGCEDPTGDESGPWLAKFRDDFVQHLATMPSAEIQRAAKAWFATEEFEPISADEISTFQAWLDTLCVHARKAHTSGKHLYLWMSL